MLVTYKRLVVLELVELKEKVGTLEKTVGSIKEEKAKQYQGRFCKTLSAVVSTFIIKQSY